MSDSISEWDLSEKVYRGMMDCARLITDVSENRIHQQENVNFKRDLVIKAKEHIEATMNKPIMNGRDLADARTAIAAARQYLES